MLLEALKKCSERMEMMVEKEMVVLKIGKKKLPIRIENRNRDGGVAMSLATKNEVALFQTQ
jgi:hypothetical protein